MTDIKSLVINYNKFHYSKIYVLHSDDFETIYIGSTVCTLEKRFKEHIRSYDYRFKNYQSNSSSHKIFEKYGIDNVTISLLEHYKCETLKDLHDKEYEYINKFDCVNIIKSNTDLYRLLNFGTTKKSNKQIITKINKEEKTKILLDYYKLIIDSSNNLEKPDYDLINNNIPDICKQVLQYVKPDCIKYITPDICFKVQNKLDYCLNYQKYCSISNNKDIKLGDMNIDNVDKFLKKCIILYNIFILIKSISNEQGLFYYDQLVNLLPALKNNGLSHSLSVNNLFKRAVKIFNMRKCDINNSRTIGNLFNKILKNFSCILNVIKRQSTEGIDRRLTVIDFVNQETLTYITHMI